MDGRLSVGASLDQGLGAELCAAGASFRSQEIELVQPGTRSSSAVGALDMDVESPLSSDLTARAAAASDWKGARPIPCLVVLAVALILWWLEPSSLPANTWHIFVIFVCTVLALILEPLPLAGSALVGLVVALCTVDMSHPEEGDIKGAAVKIVLTGFSNGICWLIVLSFFVAQGFVVTGLGKRMCYASLYLLGSSSLGIAYGVVITEILLSTALPCSVARGGGIILPILQPLMVDAFGSSPADGTERRIGSFLIIVAVHANALTSALFYTGSSWNPLIAGFAGDMGEPVNLTWVSWFVFASVPILLDLALMPLVIYLVYPPEIRRTPEAPAAAKQQLAEMGCLSRDELVMVAALVIVMGLWTWPKFDPTLAAMIGVVILLAFGVLDVNKHLLSDKGAFSCLIWFGALVMLADELKHHDFFQWTADCLKETTPAFDRWPVTLFLFSLVFYFSHYCFASVTAHVVAMFLTMATSMEGLGVPAPVAVRMLALLTCSGGLMQYTSANNPPFWNLGYVTVKDWFLVGLAVSLLHFVIFFTVGLAWWKLLGYY